jgi:hypothetical protein
MRKLALVIFVLSLSVLAKAQDDEQKYLVSDARIEVSGFGGVISEMAMINKTFSFSTGGGGALLLDRRFFIGGYGLGLSTNRFFTDYPDHIGDKLRLNFGHAGVWLGYIYKPSKRFHFGISGRGGWGSLQLTDENKTQNNEVDNTNDNVFVIAPQIEAEVNILPWLKFNVGVGYRYVSGVDNETYKSLKFNGPAFTAGLFFGGFGDESGPINDADQGGN